MRSAVLASMLVAGGLLAGCFSPSYPEKLPCDVDGWCPPGQECSVSRVCRLIEPDDGSDASTRPDAQIDAPSSLGALTGISIGDDITIAVDETYQFPVTGIYENGTYPIKGFAIWESSQTTVFFIDFQGIATGEGPGTATATARYNGRTDSAQVTVIP